MQEDTRMPPLQSETSGRIITTLHLVDYLPVPLTTLLWATIAARELTP